MLESRYSRRAISTMPWRTAIVALFMMASGCQSNWGLPWSGAPDAHGGRQASTHTTAPSTKASAATKPAADAFKALTDDNWVLALSAPDQSEPPRYRWRHHVLDDILSSPRDKQPNWEQALRAEKPIVATNAAIALARLGEGQPEGQLTSAVRSTELKLPVRRAAAEALGEVRSPAALASVRELIDQYGQFTGEARSRYVPELHGELIHSLARQSNAENDRRITEALKSPAPAVKREALEALAAVPEKKVQPLPALALDLATDSDSQVRIAALKLLVSRHDPQADDRVLRGLADYELNVRLAAIDLLGQIGGEEATARLKRLAVDPAEMIRVAAVEALASRSDRDAVEATAGDKSWRVRRVVASSLAKYPDRRSANLAKQFLSDVSLEVQREAVRSAAKWPVERSGALLLAAIASPSYQTRKDAATLLADCWPEAAGFPIDAPAPRRAELLTQLQDKWDRQFGNLDHGAIASTASSDADKVSAEALEDIEKKVDIIEHGEVAARRQALAALTKQTGKIILPEPALKRIAASLTTENDPVLWLHAFKLIEQDPREPAAMLASAGLSHPSAEVRRRACGYFAAYPDPTRTQSLLKTLSDENVSVLHAALQALAAATPPAEAQPVEKMLSHPDHALRLEAAIVLLYWNMESGKAALERMASDDDPQLRRKTAQAIGKLGDASLVPTLIKLLDDQQDIRRAALLSLDGIVGSGLPADRPNPVQAASYNAAAVSGSDSATLADRAERWKQWYRQQNGR